MSIILSSRRAFRASVFLLFAFSWIAASGVTGYAMPRRISVDPPGGGYRNLPTPLPTPPPCSPGTLDGDAGVSCTGAGTYQIPIAVPPGSAGMEPSLSLSYNSQGNGGLLGMGWSLQGLSNITRCPASKAFDGFKGAVNFDANDRYCLDGERLVAIAPFGGAIQEYRTQPNNFSRIKSYGTSATGADYFVVETKDGLIQEYGNTTDSKIEAVNTSGQTSDVRAWAVAKTSDRVGNYMLYQYNEDIASGEFRISEISYTGNGGTSPYNSVKFGYNFNRLGIDTAPYYQGGTFVINQSILTNIQTCLTSTCTGTNLVNDYRLEYELGGATNRWRMKSFKECAADAVSGAVSCLPATTFSWSDGGLTDFTANYSSGISGTTRWTQGSDVFGREGVGDPDSFFTTRTPMYLDAFFPAISAVGQANDAKSTAIAGAVLAISAVSFAINPVAGLIGWAIGSIITFTVWFADSDYYLPKAKLADVNGDGRTDIIELPKDPTLGSPEPAYVWLSKKTTTNYEFARQDGTNGRNLWSTDSLTSLDSDRDIQADEVKIGDFDGDGVNDLLTFGESEIGFNAFVRTSNGSTDFVNNGIQASSLGLIEEQSLGDFNGDGRMDVAQFSGNGHIYINNLNGDGQVVNTTNWATCEYLNLPCGNDDHPIENVLLGDINGDGKTDVIVFDYSNASNTKANIWLTNRDGNGWVSGGFQLPTTVYEFGFGINRVGVDAPDMVLPGDFNGDGKMDLGIFIALPGRGDYGNTGFDTVSASFSVVLSDGRTFKPAPGFLTSLGLESRPYALDYPDNGFTNVTDMSFLARTSDFNGDGRTDIMVIDVLGRAHLHLSDGTKLRNSYEWGSGFGKIDEDMIGDFDGDGRSDFIQFARGNDYAGKLYVSLNNRTPFPDLLVSVTNGLGKQDKFTYKPLTDDSIYLGHTSLAGLDNETINFRGSIYVVSKLETSNGLGGFYGLVYAYTGAKFHRSYGFLGFSSISVNNPQNSLLEVSDYEQVFPLVCRKKSDTTFVEVRDDRGPHGPKDGPVPDIALPYDPRGQSYSRSGSTSQSGSKNGSALTLATASDPLLEESYSVSGSSDGSEPTAVTNSYNPLSERSYSWQLNPSSGSVQSIRLDYETHVERELTGQVLSNDYIDYGYDSFDNVTLKTTYWPDVSLVAVNETASYTNNAANWVIGLPLTSTVSAQQPYPVQARQTTYAFNTTTRELNSVTNNLDGGKTLTTSYIRDDFSNPTKITVSGSDITSREENITYDALGRFPTTHENELSQTTQLNVNPRFGKLSSSMDPNLLTTAWDYDAFGRLIKITRPDGTTTQMNFCIEEDGTGHGEDAYVAPGTASWVQIVTSGQPGQAVFIDALGREIRRLHVGFSGTRVFTDTSFDSKLMLASESQPYLQGGTKKTTTYTYDTRDRVSSTVAPNGQRTYLLYSANAVPRANAIGAPHLTSRLLWNRITELKTVVTSPSTQYTSTEYIANRLGQINQVSRSSGAFTPVSTVTYAYDAENNPILSADTDGNIAVRTFENSKVASLIDPDLGVWSFSYDALGLLKSQTDESSQNTASFVYDNLNRRISRTEPEGSSAWSYDSGPNGFGHLTGTTGLYGFSESYEFDSFSRPFRTTTITPGEPTPFTRSFGYDSLGRLQSVTYPGPSNFTARREYNSNGHFNRVRNQATNALIWQADTLNAFDEVADSTHGNGISSRFAYDSQPALSSIVVGNKINGVNQLTPIKKFEYEFDLQGNLLNQYDRTYMPLRETTESFSYDAHDRLLSSHGSINDIEHMMESPLESQTFSYSAIGNLLEKSPGIPYIGYVTPGFTPHAPTGACDSLCYSFSYSDVGNTVSSRDFRNDRPREMFWFTFNKLSAVASGDDQALFRYDTRGAKITQVVITSDPELGDQQTRTDYIGQGFERVTLPSGATENKHYIYGGDAQPVALYTTRSNGANEMRYLHYDRLGSLIEVTNQNASSADSLSYDSYGSRRNWDWRPPFSAISSIVNRGYTGHEHLDTFGLIDMKGRMYDPNLGRFINPDPFITDPLMPDSSNRYAYVINNPQKYTDPTGYNYGWEGLAVKGLTAAQSAGIALAGQALPRVVAAAQPVAYSPEMMRGVPTASQQAAPQVKPASRTASTPTTPPIGVGSTATSKLRMYTAQREAIGKSGLQAQGVLKARRNQEADTQDVSKKTSKSEAARATKKAALEAAQGLTNEPPGVNAEPERTNRMFKSLGSGINDFVESIRRKLNRPEF